MEAKQKSFNKMDDNVNFGKDVKQAKLRKISKRFSNQKGLSDPS